MNKFFILLWFYWAIRLSISSILSASILSLLITFIIYAMQGFLELNWDVLSALLHIFKFYFPLVWSLMLLLYLFRGLKNIFNQCHNHYMLTLLTCPKEGLTKTIQYIGYGDIVKVWRKWFMLLIWLVAIEILIVAVSVSILGLYNSIFDWFSIYILYLFILFGAYISFMIINARCKRVKLVRC